MENMAQQKETPAKEQNDSHQSAPNDAAKQRTSKNVSDHLANERTFLAWVRTGIAVMAFGFVIERFGLLLRELGLKFGSQASSSNTVHYSKWLGITVAVLGIILLIVALLNFLHVQRTIDENRYHPGIFFAIVLTTIATLIGVLLAVYLLLTT
jgi:putative membrane protein